MLELNESGWAFVWMGHCRWHRRLVAIRWALKNLWKALLGYELTIQWDSEKMGRTTTREKKPCDVYNERFMALIGKPLDSAGPVARAFAGVLSGAHVDEKMAEAMVALMRMIEHCPHCAGRGWVYENDYDGEGGRKKECCHYCGPIRRLLDIPEER